MPMRDIVLIACLASCLAFGSAAASPLANEGITPIELANELQSAGYKATVMTDSQDRSFIISSAGGVRFMIAFYGCNSEKHCKSIQFISVFAQISQPEQVGNDWNLRKRLVKVAIDQEGRAIVSMDVILVPGGSTELVKANLDFWDSIIGDFRKIAAEHAR